MGRIRFGRGGATVLRGSRQHQIASNLAASRPDPREQYLQQFQTSQQEARDVNEQRYQSILGGYDARLSGLEGAGAQERMDIGERWRQTGARRGQDLVSRGLSGSTIQMNIGSDIARGESGDVGRLEERLRGQRMGAEMDRLRFMERREDEYPNQPAMLNLMQGLGGSGYGQGQGQGIGGGLMGQQGRRSDYWDLGGINMRTSGRATGAGGVNLYGRSSSPSLAQQREADAQRRRARIARQGGTGAGFQDPLAMLRR